jgi:hypothetical protein
MPPRIGKNNLRRALAAIEDIVSDDFCEELSLMAAEGKLKGDILLAQEKISLIYRIAHSWNPAHPCHKVHNDWRKLSAKRTEHT